jgi:hypothetical protein
MYIPYVVADLLLSAISLSSCRRRYQRRRMYTRIALGKSSAMDVVGGESSGSSGQLLLLYPMLFALQGLQVGVGRLWVLMWVWGSAGRWVEGGA